MIACKQEMQLAVLGVETLNIAIHCAPSSLFGFAWGANTVSD